MSVLYLTITTTPGSALLPNQRRRASHWSGQSAETARTRKTAEFDARNTIMYAGGGLTRDGADWDMVQRDAMAGHARGYELALTIVWPKKLNMPDLDNALGACKGIIDGIAAGLGIDDSAFTYIGIEQYVMSQPGDGCVRVAIRPNYRRVTGEEIE